MSNVTFLMVPVKANGFSVLVGEVDDAAVVAADVHAGVAGEPDRHGVVHPAFADGPVVDEERHLAAGRRRRPVGRELHADGHLAGREVSSATCLKTNTPIIE